jgi:hypothetical protein
MIYKLPSPLADHVRVVFELPANLWADQIQVVGNFQVDGYTTHPLHQTREGCWQAMLDLPVGRVYQYNYLIDGRWQADCQREAKWEQQTSPSFSLLDTTADLAVQRARNPLPLLAQWQTSQISLTPAQYTASF